MLAEHRNGQGSKICQWTSFRWSDMDFVFRWELFLVVFFFLCAHLSLYSLWFESYGAFQGFLYILISLYCLIDPADKCQMPVVNNLWCLGMFSVARIRTVRGLRVSAAGGRSLRYTGSQPLALTDFLSQGSWEALQVIAYWLMGRNFAVLRAASSGFGDISAGRLSL